MLVNIVPCRLRHLGERSGEFCVYMFISSTHAEQISVHTHIITKHVTSPPSTFKSVEELAQRRILWLVALLSYHQWTLGKEHKGTQTS